MMIGKFTQNGDGYTGNIHTVSLSLADVTISPMTVKQGNGPDFVVIGETDGAEFEIGAAWKTTFTWLRRRSILQPTTRTTRLDSLILQHQNHPSKRVVFERMR
jgi:hypothetical protein